MFPWFGEPADVLADESHSLNVSPAFEEWVLVAAPAGSCGGELSLGALNDYIQRAVGLADERRAAGPHDRG
jgi:hypothetical protein